MPWATRAMTSCVMSCANPQARDADEEHDERRQEHEARADEVAELAEHGQQHGAREGVADDDPAHVLECAELAGDGGERRRDDRVVEGAEEGDGQQRRDEEAEPERRKRHSCDRPNDRAVDATGCALAAASRRGSDPEGSRRHVDSRRSLVRNQLKTRRMPLRIEDGGWRLRRRPAGRPRSGETKPLRHRRDGATQRRAFAGLEAGGRHQAPVDRARGELGRPSGIVDLELGGRLAQCLHAEHASPSGLVVARISEPMTCPSSRARSSAVPAPGPTDAAATTRRSPASARVHPTASRTSRGQVGAVRPGTPRRPPAVRRRRVARSAEGDEIVTESCAVDDDRHSGPCRELGELARRLERHLPRFRHEHRGGSGLHGERRGIPPRRSHRRRRRSPRPRRRRASCSADRPATATW